MDGSRHTCPRRVEDGLVSDGADPDTWVNGHGLHGIQNDHPSCSFCGSLHPDTFMQWVRDGGLISVTNKSYKVYIACPYPDERYGQVAKAKVYFQHMDEAQRREFVDLCNAGRVAFDGGVRFSRLPFFMVSARSVPSQSEV